MKSLTSLLFILTLLFLAVGMCQAEGNIGFNYSRAVEDQSWGLLGDYEHETEIFDFEIEGNLQSGDVYHGKTDLSVTLNTPLPVDLRFYSNNTLKGYQLDTLGRSNDLGIAGVVKIANLDIAIGVFGRNGNPFAPRTALGTLTSTGFSESDFEGLGLENIQLAEGIDIKDGSSLNAAIETELEWNRFEIELKALLEMLGEGEKVHQVKANISTDGTLIGEFTWQVSADVVTQLYGDTVQYETSWFAGIGYAF